MDKKTREILNTAIQNSAIKAFEDYYNKTKNECWLFNTPEYLYTTKISEGISKKFDGCFVTFLEFPLEEFRKDANTGKIGRPKKAYSKGGKADIALFRYFKSNKKWKAEALIEIKLGWSWNASTIGKDVDRITASLSESGKKNNLGTVAAGYLVFMTDDWGPSRGETKQKIENRKDRILFEILNRTSGVSCIPSIKYSKYFETCESMAACIVFEFLVDKRRK